MLLALETATDVCSVALLENGRPLYRDGNHLSAAGARALFAHFKDQLDAKLR